MALNSSWPAVSKTANTQSTHIIMQENFTKSSDNYCHLLHASFFQFDNFTVQYNGTEGTETAIKQKMGQLGWLNISKSTSQSGP
jgi:hypothetical protein